MNSLLEDLIGFARENIEKAGVSFAESNQRDRNLINAYKSGAPVDPAQRQAMAEEYINQANPMSSIGGMIKPSTWRSFSPESKAVVSEVANRAPQKFKEVLDAPTDLMVDVVENLPMDIGGRYRSRRVISPTLDAPARIELNKNVDYRQNDRVLEHELTHYLNDIQNLPSDKLSRVAGSDPDDAWTFARLMQEKLPVDTRGSLDRVIGVNTMPPAGRSPMMQAFMEAFGRGMDDRLLKPMNPDQYHLQSWLAKDEALAHLAQAAAKPNATTEIRQLAKDLGVSFEDKTKEVLFGGKDSPKWNPRDVPALTPRQREFVNSGGFGPAIPREISSPGAVEAFNKMKQERGLDATFGKFTESEKPGNKILDEMYNRYIERSKNWQRQEGRKEFDLIPKDNFVERVIDWIGGHMSPSQLPYENIKFPRGIGAFRRGMYGAPNNPKPGRRGSMIGGNKMPADETISLLRYLDKYGLLDENILGRELGDSGKPTGQMLYMDPNKMNRLRRLVEEPQAHPSKIKR